MAIIHGSNQGETVPGTAEADEIHGLGGHITIQGGAGNDVVYGDSGDDFLDGQAGQDSVYGGSGNDTLMGTDSGLLDGSTGNDLFILAFNGRGDLIARGGSGSDSFTSFNAGQPNDFLIGVEMYGDGGNDTFTFYRTQACTIDGGSGNDRNSISTMLSGAINGGSYDDRIDVRSMLGTISGDSGSDVITAGATKIGTKIYGGTGHDVISVGAGSAIMDGGSGDDYITSGVDYFTTASKLLGGSGQDVLKSQGLDVLDGGTGRDILESAAFGNVLTGGNGADLFVHGSMVDLTSPSGIRVDTITDFSIRSGDWLDFSVLLDRASASRNPVVNGWLGIESVSGGSALLFDANGGGDEFVQLAILQGVALSPVDLDQIIIG